MTPPDRSRTGGTEPIRAFLDDRHVAFALEARALASQLAKREHPSDDDAARVEARTLLPVLAPLTAGVGLPLDLRALCIAREAIAWASPLADAVFALQALGAVPVLLAGTEEQRERWAAPLAAGTRMGGFAMTEPNAGSDVSGLATRAVRVPDQTDYVLNGVKTFISNAGIADQYVVFAATAPERQNRGLTAFVVDAKNPGCHFERALVMSAPHPLGVLRFTDCRVPESARLGAEGDGFKLGMATLDRLRPTVAAAATGLAARALDEALAYAKRRVQFGRPIADTQLIQDKLAVMATELTAARLLLYRAAWAGDQGQARISLESAMAKAHATEVAQRVIDAAVQIHGGLGVLADSTVDLLYRSVRALRIYEGTTEVQHLVIARHLLQDTPL